MSKILARSSARISFDTKAVRDTRKRCPSRSSSTSLSLSTTFFSGAAIASSLCALSDQSLAQTERGILEICTVYGARRELPQDGHVFSIVDCDGAAQRTIFQAENREAAAPDVAAQNQFRA